MGRERQAKPGRSHTRQRHYYRGSQCSPIAGETQVAIRGAMEVHRALCAPERQRVGGYELASRVVPARHISGDFIYGVQCEQMTFVVLGDLMGKGLSAAMWITHIVDLVHRAAEGSRNVSDLLSRLNMEILNSRVKVPLTSAVAFSFSQTGSVVSCASAGHPPAIIVRSEARVEIAKAGGPLLGIFPGAQYNREDVELRKGDSIIAFSDGLIEVGEDHDEFTVKDVMTVAAKEAAATPDTMVSRLLEASKAIAGENPLDDISVLVLQRS